MSYIKDKAIADQLKIDPYPQVIADKYQQPINVMLLGFWLNGGKDRWDQVLKIRPDKKLDLWLKAQLMAIIDDSAIVFK